MLTLNKYVQESLGEVNSCLQAIRPELLDAYGNVKYSQKTDSSVVTKLDKKVEKLIKDTLRPIDKNVGFYGEEFGIEGNQDKFWTIDPIDGTEAFIRGIPFCSNMIALIEDGEVKAALIYNFVLDELYTAIKNKGSSLNGKAISVSDRNISRAAIEYETKTQPFNNGHWHIDLPNCLYYTFAAAGFGFCQVAKGVIEARVSHNPWGKIWDYAPGSLLVQEAGGIVANVGNNNYDYKNVNFIASNKLIFNDLQDSFKGFNKI